MRIVYQGAARPIAEVQAEVAAFFEDAVHDPNLAPGVTTADLLALRDGFELQVPDAGLAAETVAVIAVFAPTVNHVLISVWDDLILPRLRRRLDDDALGDEISRGPG